MADSEAAAVFTERFVEADGFRIRYMEAGQGTPLIHLHGAGGLRMTRAHDLLSQHYRVIVFEMPGFGRSPRATISAWVCPMGRSRRWDAPRPTIASSAHNTVGCRGRMTSSTVPT